MHFIQRSHRLRSIFLPSSRVIVIAPRGQTSTQAPHPLHKISLTMSSGEKSWDSGLEHQRQRKGHPFRKTVVLIPGPSWTLNFWMLKTSPLSCFDESVFIVNPLARGFTRIYKKWWTQKKVAPAKAGVQETILHKKNWIPAFAGMTLFGFCYFFEFINLKRISI